MLFKLFAKHKIEARITLKHWLLISCIFSCVLVCARVIATGYLTYLFLPWNLFLAFVPYVISEWLSRNVAVMEHKWKRVLVLFGWLLFIPNAFYIVTDLFHLEQFDDAPKWFDLLLLFSFAWNGLLFGILSVRKTELIVRTISGYNFSIPFVFAVMWLNAFGIYIGRFLRYNSWDIVTQPFSLLEEMMQVLLHPLRNKMEWGMISTWAIFMTLFYFTIKTLIETSTLRHPSTSSGFAQDDEVPVNKLTKK
jgi:uncharacterized membrane protein